GSRPFLGENAIDKLMDMYGELRGAVKTVQSADEWGITMNLGRIRGGLAVNQVPDHAELHLDIRYAKSEESEHVLHEVKRITKGQFDVVAEGYPVDEDRDNAWIVKYADMLEKHGVEVKYDKEEGGSDARFFAEKQIPVIITCLQKGNIHSDKEWVVTDDLGQFQTILSQYLVENVRPVTLSQSAVV
ncbi:MAG TPA: M20/M25/M40 family metallo-hydrolase, partial [Candidatus Gracilibacteria bacterium]|nr:M20/M25/M40 family metallo-hydrolase [Candidatus Gracilibacteria bacterium]